ncbi:MAG: Tex family protein [Labilithrix sp.]
MIADSCPRIAQDLGLSLASVRATVNLLTEGATVPFIARYRKEATGGLDEVQIRAIEEKLAYYTELLERRKTVVDELTAQGKLTPDLARRIESIWVKSELEDLYLPFRPKRRTRATMAREKGYQPLADAILAQGPKRLDADADALAGARDIVAETVAERADVRAGVRDLYRREAVLVCERVKKNTQQPTKFEMYYDFREKLDRLPSHRYLAIRRGEEEGVLRVRLEVDEKRAAQKIYGQVGLRAGSPLANELRLAVDDAMERLIAPSIETEVSGDQKLRADADAIDIFAQNLKKLLLSAPLGRRVVLGIDPGQRTGCKCVVVDDTGRLVEHTLINLVTGDAALAQAKKTIAALVKKYSPFAVAVGNGTHGRETEDFVKQVLREENATIMVVPVSESGASVYSASEVAREEFPDLDLTVRGAVSIARRLQDPLAELVKLDPKVIGVGQYQHDVSQPLLKKKLEEVVESCVNAVGVELNTASASLLEHVAGLGPKTAKAIVKHREAKGAFESRSALKEVAGIGPKAFEQCAGFVRVRGGAHPLDASAVHPERYALVDRIAKEQGVKLAELVGHPDRVARIPWASYASNDVGLPTLEDIQAELGKPGRDPRDAFEPPKFRDDVRTMADLKEGMELEGVVTNVTAFGAFVDIGVHQDGLVHISQLADRFVRDPHEVVKVGDKLKVHVMAVDLPRKRISLSARRRAS